MNDDSPNGDAQQLHHNAYYARRPSQNVTDSDHDCIWNGFVSDHVHVNLGCGYTIPVREPGERDE